MLEENWCVRCAVRPHLKVEVKWVPTLDRWLLVGHRGALKIIARPKSSSDGAPWHRIV